MDKLRALIELSTVKVDVVLSYCKYTLNDCELLKHLSWFKEQGIGVINASPFAMGLLTENGPPAWHPGSFHSLIHRVIPQYYFECNIINPTFPLIIGNIVIAKFIPIIIITVRAIILTISYRHVSAAKRETQEAALEAAQFCKEEGTSLTRLALQYTLSNPAVPITLVGCENVEQLSQNIQG